MFFYRLIRIIRYERMVRVHHDLIKQESKNRNEDAPCALNFMSDAEDNEAQTTDSLRSLHENLFLGNLKCLG